MICPYCGNRTDRAICENCKNELPQNSKRASFSLKACKFIYNINCILLPPAKYLSAFWSFCWIYDLTIGKFDGVFTIVCGYIILILISDIIYICKRNRYLSYKRTILEKKLMRMHVIKNKYYANFESDVSNNTNFDNMEGFEFEHFCADILSKNGFENVEVTQSSGDHGIDILAEKYGISYAIQCKCYSSNIGNSAVQQAHTGKSLYHKDIAVVLTNQYFTQQAIDEASVLGVKLWDRDKLQELISNQNINKLST